MLSALGECLLVGSLDVIYHHPVQAPISMPIKIRYLAAFLYAGFFVLCKAKKGKIYSAHHFLPLERLEISEGQPGKSAPCLLACSHSIQKLDCRLSDRSRSLSRRLDSPSGRGLLS